jgi:hypothetical protein
MPELNNSNNQITTTQDLFPNTPKKQTKIEIAGEVMPKLPKFNFTASQEDNKSKQVTKALLRSGIFIMCIAASSIFLVLPLISQGADIVPINSNPSNEQLSITSLKSPFYLTYNNNIFYSTNNKGVHTLNLGQSITTGEVEIGTYLDLGFTKINSSKKNKYSINRSFTAPTFTTNLNQYQDRKTGDYDLVLSTNPDFIRLYNNEALIYETNSSNNICKLKSETKTIKCPYDYLKLDTLNYSLRTSDKYGNFSPTFKLQTSIVPVNDFSCEILRSNTPKISCYGSKPGIIELDSQSTEYKAYTRVILPYTLSTGANKIKAKMTDIHNIVVPINLNFDFDQSPLTVILKTSNQTVTATPSKNISSIIARLTLKQTANNQSNSDTDLSREVSLLTTNITKSTPTDILTNYINLPKSSITFPRFKLSNLELEFQDESANILIKQCSSDIKLEEEFYRIELNCNN